MKDWYNAEDNLAAEAMANAYEETDRRPEAIAKVREQFPGFSIRELALMWEAIDYHYPLT
jgi:hypothetical protein